MARITAEERRKIPKEDFGDWRGTPESSLFPIRNQEDLDSAAHLIGKASEGVKAKIEEIAKRKKLTLPESWGKPASMSADAPALMSATLDLGVSSRRVEGDFAIYPESLLWIAGEYVDKAYEMSPEEGWAAVEAFTPVSGNIEHTDWLRGVACHVRALRLDPHDVSKLRGEVAVPLGLDLLMRPQERKLSCEWNRHTKTLSSLALTTNPRVPEAVLMSMDAVFGKRMDTPQGQEAMQALHDVAAKHGAVCRTANAHMSSHHEHKALQHIHDHTLAHGAVCVMYPSVVQSPPTGGNDADDTPAATMSRTPSGERKTRKFPGGFTTVHMDSIKFWKQVGRRFREEARQEGITAVPEEEVFSLLSEAEEDERERVRKEVEAEFSTRLADITAKEKAAQAALFAATAQRLQGEASSFADGLIMGNKLLPAEREGLIAALTTAGLDDANHGVASFTNGAQGSRVEQLKKLYETRPAHTLTQEQLKTAAAGGQVVFNNLTTPSAADADTRFSTDDLLAMTPAGKHAIKLKSNGHSKN